MLFRSYSLDPVMSVGKQIAGGAEMADRAFGYFGDTQRLAWAQDELTGMLRSGRSRFNLSTLPESDFPDVTSGEFSHRFALAPGDLKRYVRAVMTLRCWVILKKPWATQAR